MSEAAFSMPVQPARTGGQLLRILGVAFGIAVIIGGTVGSGILRTPGEVAGYLPSRALILGVWLLGGIYAFFGTVSVTELGTMLPFTGGWYVYSRRALGPYLGFVVGCCDWMVQTISVGYLAVAFGEFSAELLPQFSEYVKLTGVTLLAVLMLLNWIGIRCGSRAQEITSFAKMLALALFVAGCFLMAPPSSEPERVMAVQSQSTAGLFAAIVVSLQAVIVTYDGWYLAIYFTEEDKEPAKNLPRSTIAAVLACIGIYLLINLALLHVLPLGRFSGSHMPVSDAAMMIFGARGKQMLLVASLVAALSTINATVLSSPRILLAMGRDALMPARVTSINRGGTPVAALLVGTVVAMALVLAGSFETLVAIAAILFVVVYLSGFISLFILRMREPHLPRPFKAWLYPWGNLFVLLASAAFLVGAIVADLKDALFTLLFLTLTFPLYLLMKRMNREAVTRSAEQPMPNAARH